MKYNLASNEPLEINSTLFVKGLGNYKGDNSQTAQSIQTVLSNIQSKTDATISSLSNKVNQDTYAMDKEDLEMRVNSAESLAQGAQQALAFDNYSALIQYLNPGMITNLGNVLKVGQNLYIKQLNVPDLWISAFRTPDELTAYTYTTDDAFIEYINNGGWVGCYQLSQLETLKVDLTNYATKSEVTAVDTKINNIPVEKGEGYGSIIAKDDTNHAYGKDSVSLGHSTIAGNSNKIITDPEDPTRADEDAGYGAFVSGLSNTASGRASYSEGEGNTASGAQSHAEGNHTTASGKVAHAEGNYTTASGEHSHAEGNNTTASGIQSHAEGNYTKASSVNSHAEGTYTTASGDNSHAEGSNTTASMECSHAEGFHTEASGPRSHAEGNQTTASGEHSHAEGDHTTASNYAAHSEGVRTTASGVGSHVEGIDNKATTRASHAEGLWTKTSNEAEHAQGKYNKSNTGTIHSIGIGTSDSLRKNAVEVMQNGDVYVNGIGGYDGTNPANSKDIATYLPNMVTITYTKLKSLRDNGKLIPGQQYRINYYTCTTTQENTRSAGHVFDIIVTADSENKLNEEARAIQHTDDKNNYFAGCNLKAWKLWYSLDNDTNRFSWADNSSNGRGVIYRMIDEFGNDCPYDFKNIQFARWQLSNPVGYRNDFDYNNWQDNWFQETTKFDSLKTGFYGLNNTDNEFYYGYNEETGSDKYKVVYTISGSPTYCYTFGKDTDYSIKGSNYSNVIKEYKPNNKIQLNNIVFLSRNCYSNSFSNNCFENSFGDYCYSNSFGDYCYFNSFGGSCNFNSFGNGCYSNSFGGSCYSNTFGNNCYSNGFSNNCFENSFGNGCNSNGFGDDFCYNSFGNYCYSNSFGNYCYSNSFGNYCYSNTFSDGCENNNFGNYCYSNSLGNDYDNNSFGNYCYSNSFGNNYSNNSFGNSCQYIKFVSDSDDSAFTNYYMNNHFGDGCEYILFKASETASPNNQVQNYNLSQGLKGTSTAYLTINGVRNRSFETKVAKNSAGTLKIYCEADLIL